MIVFKNPAAWRGTEPGRPWAARVEIPEHWDRTAIGHYRQLRREGLRPFLARASTIGLLAAEVRR